MERDVLTRLPASVEVLHSMEAIYIDCGTSDSFNVLIDLRRTRDELQRLGISHDYREFSGSHTCCVMTSTGDALKVFSEAMAFEMLVGVESAGKLATTRCEIRRAQ